MQSSLSSRAIFTRLTGWWAALRATWYGSAVLVPFAFTRLAWVLAAAFARGTLAPNPTYQRYAQQGGIHTRIFLLDIFAHWDAGFYLSIIKDGYWSTRDFTSQYSNTAFYPLYPYLVKSIGWLGINVPTSGYLAIGLLLSNLCFLGSMALLYRLAVGPLKISDAAARRAILLLMVFPSSFFFSSFYNESLFLFLAVLGFWAAHEQRWWLVGVACALAVLTRVQGLLVLAALGWMYMAQRGWRLRAVRADILWFLLAPLGLGVHFYTLYRLTGDFFAPFSAQVAWKRNVYGLFEGLWMQVNAPALDVYKIDAAVILLFLVCGIWMLRRYPRAYGIFTILMSVIPVLTGLVTGGTRYVLAIFPVFLLLGERLENRRWFELVLVLSFTLQILYFAAWANYYFVA